METVGVDRRDGIVTVTMNRPERKNAANVTMWEELLAAFREIASNPEDRVMVLTGAGGEFCSGADLSGGAQRDEHGLARMRKINSVCMALARMPQPTIAKVRGVAVGAGCNMALICDLVVASDNARFSQIFSKRGLSLDFGGSWVLPRRVGLHRAKELAFFADILSASESSDMGLVNRVVNDEALDAFVDDWATRLAAGPPIALAQTKALLNNAVDMTLDEALEAEAAAQTINFQTKDVVEAFIAFNEKREPRFTGR
jgi:2-(1,2-epoxy-1,2-dihydrophenyl)acetyl-CoA isomerase